MTITHHDNKNQPLVSVLMTVWNEARFLEDAINSLLQQSYPNFEIVIVDDGSDDQSPSILERFALQDKRVRVHKHQKLGRSASLNEALKQACGELIAIADSDDITHPQRLEKGVEFLAQNPDIGFAASYYQQIDSNGNTIKTLTNAPTSPQVLKKVLEQENPIAHGTIILRRQLLESIQGYREIFAATVDYDMYLRLLDQTEFGLIPEILYSYRIHGNSMSSKRLLQLQMRSLAQALLQERRQSPDGLDSLQRLADQAAQKKWLEQYLAADIQTNKTSYSQTLFQAGKKYYKLGDKKAALNLFQHVLKLNPLYISAYKYSFYSIFKS